MSCFNKRHELEISQLTHQGRKTTNLRSIKTSGEHEGQDKIQLTSYPPLKRQTTLIDSDIL